MTSIRKLKRRHYATPYALRGKVKIKLRLSKDEVAFLQGEARRRGVTIDDVIAIALKEAIARDHQV